MVKRTVKVGRLFSWSRNFDVDRDENILTIIAHVGDREYHLRPDVATVKRLKDIRDRVLVIMLEDVLIEGSIAELWEKQMVQYPAYEKEEYVKTQ